MSWIDRPQIRIARRDGRFTAELRTGETFRYDAVRVERSPETTESVCPTLDHVVSVAGW